MDDSIRTISNARITERQPRAVAFGLPSNVWQVIGGPLPCTKPPPEVTFYVDGDEVKRSQLRWSATERRSSKRHHSAVRPFQIRCGTATFIASCADSDDKDTRGAAS